MKYLTTIISFIAFFFFSASDLEAAQVYHPDGTPSATPIVDQPYGYTGRREDAESGLDYYRARYYSSDQGRFISRDPIGYVDGYSLYQYCRSNPFKYLDPKGLAGEMGHSSHNFELLQGDGFAENISNWGDVQIDFYYGDLCDKDKKGWIRIDITITISDNYIDNANDPSNGGSVSIQSQVNGGSTQMGMQGNVTPSNFYADGNGNAISFLSDGLDLAQCPKSLQKGKVYIPMTMEDNDATRSGVFMAITFDFSYSCKEVDTEPCCVIDQPFKNTASIKYAGKEGEIKPNNLPSSIE